MKNNRKALRVLVTGGAGFIGSHAVLALLGAGHDVLVIDDLSAGKKGAVPDAAALVVADIRSAKAGAAIRAFRPDAVVHLAAQMVIADSLRDPSADASVNVLGGLAVLSAALEAGCRHMVFASSAAVYSGTETYPSRESDAPFPTSPYGAAKLSFEHYLRAFEKRGMLTASILRFANVYGPGQTAKGEAGVVAVFCDRLSRREPVTIHGDGTQTRDYVFVADVARAILRCVELRRSGTYNVGTGREVSVAGLYAALAGVAGVHTKPRFAKRAAAGDRRSALHPGRAKKELGWQATTDLASGLAMTYAASGN